MSLRVRSGLCAPEIRVTLNYLSVVRNWNLESVEDFKCKSFVLNF
jgi:hypothetical protein